MEKLKINSIDKFINFILPIFAEECNMYEIENKIDSVYYFVHGGCYELAQIIKHFFPNSEFLLRNDHDHVAILYKDRVYDAYDGLDQEEIDKIMIPPKDLDKSIENFEIITKDEIDSHYNFGINLHIEGKPVVDWFINEINNIESIEVIDEDEKSIKR